MNARTILALISVVLLVAGSCSDKSTGPDESSIFSHPYPADDATDIPTTAELTWQSGLGSESGASYKVYISTIPDPEHCTQPQQNQSPGGLLPGQTYYWQVRSQLPGGRTYVSPMWHFRTAEHYQYPLELNTGWRYRVRFFITDVVPNDVVPVSTDTAEYATYVTVAALEDIPFSFKSAYKLVETIQYGDEQPSNDTSVGWFNNEPDGFYEYGYEAGSYGLALPRKLTSDNRWQMDPTIARIFSPSALQAPGIINDQAEPVWETVKCLSYPLRKGLSWEPSSRTDIIRITKRVMGKSRIESGGNDYLCWTVRWFYEGIDNLSMIDQIGEPGLVSRTTVATGIRLTNQEYPEGFATATIHQEIELDYTYLLDTLGLDPDDFHGGDR